MHWVPEASNATQSHVARGITSSRPHHSDRDNEQAPNDKIDKKKLILTSRHDGRVDELDEILMKIRGGRCQPQDIEAVGTRRDC